MELRLYEDAILEIASRLDLRDPNAEAVQTLQAEVSQHYDVEGRGPPFEAVIDSATGVGKTYILTGAMELLAATSDVRDFVIITPGRTILKKTRDNFTPGHAKSLLGPMSFRPIVITTENFATPAMRQAMDDETVVKVYLFTVQSLLKPRTRTARKTRKFQEGLGTEFYAHLQHIAKLVVFADEHHVYYASAFSDAVRELNPWLLVGLTATPSKRTPEEQIIYRYPLAAAIADKLVKTPVIVGRRDDRTDAETKLTDGVTLLHAKREAVHAYAEAHGVDSVNPVMLVVAKDIEAADEYGEILRSQEFFAGAYADAVLVVHSDSADEALEELAKVEEPDSPVRIIISVGMLKEGWDVKNVYVIASMRSSVSDILTEQTLGRGMRLPFGEYTGIEILDTLEVVAHERYEELLKKRGVLNEAFVDYRTRAVLRMNAQNELVAVTESVETSAVPIIAGDGGATTYEGATVGESGVASAASGGVPVVGDGRSGPIVTTVDERAAQAGQAAAKMKQEIQRAPDAPKLVVPLLRMTAIESNFSLADITDTDSFRKLGTTLAADPDGELSRTLFSARVVKGPDGVKRTELIRSKAADHIKSAPTLFALDELREKLTEIVLASPAVPARKEERRAFQPLLEVFLVGLGEKAEEVLSANLERAGARLVKLVGEEQRHYMAKPKMGEVIKLEEFNPTRATDKDVTDDRFGPFSKALAYSSWKRSIFPVAWFDSEPERRVANMVDGDAAVACWVRLHINELPILWNSAGQEYNPDLIVVEADGTHFVVEAKMEKEMTAADVQAKRQAAMRWANHVSASREVSVQWRYLLVSESDINTAKGSWEALKKLGGV